MTLVWALIILCGIVSAQGILDEPLMQRLMADHSRVGANVHTYDFLSTHDSPAPKGYSPFYISHYGRHGSRADMGGERYQFIIQTIEQKQLAGLSSPKEDSLLALTRRVQESYGGMDRRLTEVGQKQHVQLAQRMYHRFHGVFHQKKSQHVRAVSSEVPRCMASMAAFTNGLTSCQPQLQYTFLHGQTYQEYINCRGLLSATYDIVPSVIDSVMDQYPIDTTTCSKDWQDAVFSTIAYAQSFGIPCDAFYFLSPEIVFQHDARTTLHFYLNFCNAENYGVRRRAFAQHGLNDFIKRADEVIAYGGVCADLRFGHDDPLLCIASLMELEGVGDFLPIDSILSHWFAYENVAMASNIQVVFYKAKNKEILVKVLYNEKETHIRGLKAINSYYYRWSDVRQLWLHTHRFATYNVRYVNKKNGDVGEKYWGNRSSYVIRNILDNQIDIVGLQEVTGNNKDSVTGMSQLQDLQNGLTEYTCIAYEREDKNYSYNAIFYRTKKYNCIKHYSFWLSETPDVVSKMCDQCHFRRCIVALMEDRLTHQRFYFCDAHTDYDPIEAGERQAELIGKKLRTLTDDGTPLVLVGDLNHDRYDKPSIYTIYARYFHDANLPDHDTTPTYKKWCTITDNTYRGLEIDYHFYQHMLPFQRVVVTEDYGRAVAPSDHFPVYVDFQLEASKEMDTIK